MPEWTVPKQVDLLVAEEREMNDLVELGSEIGVDGLDGLVVAASVLDQARRLFPISPPESTCQLCAVQPNA